MRGAAGQIEMTFGKKKLEYAPSPQHEELGLTVAGRKRRDAIFYRWFGYHLVSPIALLPVGAFALAWWVPEFAAWLRESLPEGPWVGAADMRSRSTAFDAAASSYWLVLYLLLPLFPLWMHWLACRVKFYRAACAVMRANLDAGFWNPTVWTVRGGWLRLGGGVLMGAVLACVLLFVRVEPSFCRGCETRSWLGFLIVNWLGVHALLLFTYQMSVYLFFWQFIREGNRQ